MKKRNLLLLFLSAMVLAAIYSCKNPDPEPAEDIELADNHDNEDDYTIDTTAAHQTLLKGSSIMVTGTGSSGSGTIVTISKAGIYSISGTLSKGQVIVTTSDKEDVKLVFNGVNITNNGVPVVIQSAEKTVINLAAGTENTLTDAKTYVFEGLSDEPNAALFSKSDSTIFEEGKLTLNANYNDGIASKDGLIMSSGNFTVNAIDDGIRGNDYLIVRGGGIY